MEITIIDNTPTRLSMLKFFLKALQGVTIKDFYEVDEAVANSGSKLFLIHKGNDNIVPFVKKITSESFILFFSGGGINRNIEGITYSDKMFNLSDVFNVGDAPQALNRIKQIIEIIKNENSFEKALLEIKRLDVDPKIEASIRETKSQTLLSLKSSWQEGVFNSMTKDKTKQFFILDEETKFLASNVEGESKVIASSDEFENALNEGIQIKDVVILVELDWGEPISQFYGYTVARQLMERLKEGESLNLLFISCLKRKTIKHILQAAKTSYAFTQTFPHTIIGNDFALSNLKLPSFSNGEFQYYFRYCLTNSGVLDRLEHDIRPYGSGVKTLAPIDAQKLIERMHSIKDIVGEKVIDVVNSCTTETLQNRLHEIQQHIFQQSEQLTTSREYESKGQNDWKSRMLIVEDDTTYLEYLKNTFAENFEVTTEPSGEEALRLLQEKGKMYHVLLCDLELLDVEGDNQLIQGIKILEEVKQRFPHIVCKVITNLPRRGAYFLLGKELRAELIYKSMLIDDNYRRDLIQEIKIEIGKLSSLQKLPGPDNTLWGDYPRQRNSKGAGHLRRIYYQLREEYKVDFDEMWREIDEYLEKVLKNEQKIPTGYGRTENKNDIATLSILQQIKTIKSYVIHRLFWLYKEYRGVSSVQIFHSTYDSFFEKGSILKDGQYGTITGFSIEKQEDKSKVTFGQFLEEESIRIRKHLTEQENVQFDLINSWLNENIVDILEVMGNYKNRFTKSQYIDAQSFCEKGHKGTLQLQEVEEILENIAKETPTSELRDNTSNARASVAALLQSIKTSTEWNMYTPHLQNLITSALQNMS